MARRRTFVTVCDICGRETDTLRCRISIGDGPLRHVDICAPDRKPLEAFAARLPQHNPVGARVPVVTIEDLAAGRAGTKRVPGRPRRRPETPLSRDNTAPLGDGPETATPGPEAESGGGA